MFQSIKSAALLLLITAIFAGCTSSSGDHSQRSGDRIYRTGERDPDHFGGDRYDAGYQIRDLPDNAVIVAERRGQRIEYVTRNPGQYYVYEVGSHRIVTSGRADEGQHIVVNPDEDWIAVDNKGKYKGNLKNDGTYRLYFARSDGRRVSEGGISRDDRYDDRNRDRDRNTTDKLPKDSEVVEHGRGKLDFTARADGEYYIYDETADNIIKDGTIRKGQRLVLDPAADRITLDGQTVSKRKLDSTNSFRIQFLKARID